MNSFELKIWDDEGTLCTFYTVHVDKEEENETDKFFDKYDDSEEFEEATGMLLTFVLNVIGDEHGAKDYFFNRHENQVFGFPPRRINLREVKYHFPNFPLRLYALKISEEIVVLFNGGVKDGPTNQTSSLNMEWHNACQFAKAIEDAIRSEDIIIDRENRKLKWYNDSEEIVLYR